MKNKTLKKLIKAKADDVMIKDFTLEIIEKANAQISDPIVTRKSPSPWRLKPVFALSLALVTTLILAFIWTPSLTDDPFVIEAYDQAIMMSSVSMVYAYEAEENETVALIPSSVIESDYLIEDEINGLNQYLPLIEQLFESDAEFNKEIIDTKDTAYIYHLIFSSKTLSNTTVTYELKLYDGITKTHGVITVDGEISLLDETYPITITFSQNSTNAFVMTSFLENEQTIEVSYENDQDQAIYQLYLKDQDTVVKKLMLKNDRLNQTIDLNFEKGTINGTYRFRISEQKVLGVSYAIIKDSISETGHMDITVTPRENMPTLYDIEVRPQGGTPFNRAEEREPTPPRPAPNPMPPRGPRN